MGKMEGTEGGRERDGRVKERRCRRAGPDPLSPAPAPGPAAAPCLCEQRVLPPRQRRQAPSLLAALVLLAVCIAGGGSSRVKALCAAAAAGHYIVLGHQEGVWRQLRCGAEHQWRLRLLRRAVIVDGPSERQVGVRCRRHCFAGGFAGPAPTRCCLQLASRVGCCQWRRGGRRVERLVHWLREQQAFEPTLTGCSGAIGRRTDVLKRSTLSAGNGAASSVCAAVRRALCSAASTRVLRGEVPASKVTSNRAGSRSQE